MTVFGYRDFGAHFKKLVGARAKESFDYQVCLTRFYEEKSLHK